MPDLDKALRKVAQTIIGGFGTSVTMRKTTASAYSTATHKVTSTPVDTTIKGRLSDYEAHEIVGRVQVGDRKLTIAAADLTYTPRTEDEAVIGNRIYSIEDVASPQATDEAALHIMQIRGGAAAERAFLPTDLSGLVLWLRADSLSGWLDGDAVHTWTDESGQSNHATQSTAAKRPIYKTGIVNGKPVVRFDGIDDGMQLTSDVSEAISDHTIIFVVDPDSVPADGEYLLDSANGRLILAHSGPGSPGDIEVYDGGGWRNIAATAIGWQILTFNLDDVAAEVFRDGASIGSDAAYVRQNTRTPIGLGAVNDISAAFFAGDIAEVIIYTRVVTVGEQQSLDEYLSNKYGITLA